MLISFYYTCILILLFFTLKSIFFLIREIIYHKFMNLTKLFYVVYSYSKDVIVILLSIVILKFIISFSVSNHSIYSKPIVLLLKLRSLSLHIELFIEICIELYIKLYVWVVYMYWSKCNEQTKPIMTYYLVYELISFFQIFIVYVYFYF